MEVASAAPQTVPEPLRSRRTPLPLSQLVERSRGRAHIPNYLLDSKIYTKLQRNSLIEADPPELHFSGFEPGKDCVKILKLINVSCEVMNIHIIPTQTKHFQTSYTKKFRLIPGLAYTLRIQFCPNEWRYFYDCVRVHCEGEENLLIPVHAYPVIDDLHIPPHIDLSAVPLGHSVSRVIPLRCSCPIDFEFQVHVIQPHEAFSIHPLTGVIPAHGEVKLTVTFKPSQYETCQVTMQLLISQFNTKPFLCTVTGRCAPLSALSQVERKSGHGDTACPEPSAVGQLPPRSKTKVRSTKDAGKLKRDQRVLKPPVDVCTPSGVAKMLMKDTNKLSAKALREALSCGSASGLHNKQMKEALFLKKLHQNVKENDNHLRWKSHVGKEPVSEKSRRQILEHRQDRRGDMRQVFAAGQTEVFSTRVQCEAGQAPGGAPTFHFHSTFHLELRHRAVGLLQQAARKVVIRCRANRRLACLKKHTKNLPPPSPLQKVKEKETTACDEKIPPDKVFPSSFPVFSMDDEPLALSGLVTAPTAPVDVDVTMCVPLFKLQVPQRYKLMDYKPVSTWEAFTSYVPATLARPLRSGPQDDVQPPCPSTEQKKKQQQTPPPPPETEEDAVESLASVSLSFTVPEALLRPLPANPLRIFNPAPGLQTYKPTPKYMETDLEFYLSPLPRYTVPESNICTRTQTLQRKLLHHKEVIEGVMTWKDFDSLTFKCLSDKPGLITAGWSRSVDYNTDVLPLTGPCPLSAPLDDVSTLMDKECEGSGVQLTPAMIRAQFLPGDALVSRSNRAAGAAGRQQTEVRVEAASRRVFNQMGRRVTARLKQLGAANGAAHPPCGDREEAKTPAHSDNVNM
ncbi:hypothetical protein JOB18_028203 [Solea senegalensis]|uniref:Cep192-like domain-containing protein n=1 Tax=Solea senegalensis TaxID=28829 RepID=A0AAV6RF20_SOLSE|nr:cilia- and flagella-associated protein 221 isoform X1 [Solea senegalensis]XP_043874976.1 cilia- and flagella-associated protein 221 isoform X1 [Solea senegalensis]XP_043874977.1 cilia- and flagella-associated protein 221 isoform X1 [Solea senegalensis]KAG7502887.1 hypothetical protein JOB18_028203 [Solea senegalensis]